MRPRVGRWGAPLVCLLLVACGEKRAVPDAAATTDAEVVDAAGEGVPDDIDTSAAGLTAFAKGGRYKAWVAEAGPHKSAGPHGGNVRVFYNSVLLQSLRSGTLPHPKGSAVVKELFGAGTTTITGHAINVKIADGASADTWIFFEGFTSSDYRNPYYGQGLALCADCHASGNDHVLSALP